MSKIYRHNKTGNLYLLLYEANETTNGEPVIVYQALYGNCNIWVRPYNEFYEMVEINGKQKLRFEPISIEKM